KFNWTMYCSDCNANSSDVAALIEAGGLGAEADLPWVLSPLNAGSHDRLYSDMSTELGSEFPVPIVDDDGVMVGWAMFHLTGSLGGSDKTLSGYFVSRLTNSTIDIL